MQYTLTCLLHLLGGPVKLVDGVASRMVPVSALDERELGDTYRRRFDSQAVAGDADQEYLDALVEEIRRFARKPFPYRAYAIGYYGAPNAMALPGGGILVDPEVLAPPPMEAGPVAVASPRVWPRR